jgi:Polysaccharide lyase/Secretion system C-terminal sorting domain
MKTEAALKLALTLTLFFGLKIAQSQVLWYGNPNEPLTRNFRQLNTEPGEDGTATTVNDPQMGKVWKINKPSGSKRTEFARTLGYIPKEGDKVYVGWRVKINIAGSKNPSGFAIFQLKTEGDGQQNHPVSIDYDGTRISVDGVNPGTGCVSCRQKTFCTKAMNENTWTDIVLGFKFSKNASIGYVEVWINGVKQALLNDNANKQSFHRTIDTGEMYFKWGAYNEASRPYNITVYMDEMRVAKSYNQANPDTYNSGSKLNIIPTEPDLSDEPTPEFAEVKSTAFPNPTTGLSKIPVAANTTIRVINHTGAVVLQKESTSDDEVALDLNNLPAGTYYIQTINKGTSKSQRLILQE